MIKVIVAHFLMIWTSLCFADEAHLVKSDQFGDLSRRGIYCNYDANDSGYDPKKMRYYYYTFQCFQRYAGHATPFDASQVGTGPLYRTATSHEVFVQAQMALWASGEEFNAPPSTEVGRIIGAITSPGTVMSMAYNYEFADRMSSNLNFAAAQQYQENMAKFNAATGQLSYENQRISEELKEQFATAQPAPPLPYAMTPELAAQVEFKFTMPAIYENPKAAQQELIVSAKDQLAKGQFENGYLSFEALAQEINPTQETKDFVKSITNSQGVIDPQKINPQLAASPLSHLNLRTKANTPDGVAIRQIINRAQMGWVKNAFALPVPLEKLGAVSQYFAMHSLINIADIILSGADSGLYSHEMAALFLTISKTYADLSLGLISGAEDSVTGLLHTIRALPHFGYEAFQFLRQSLRDPQSTLVELERFYLNLPFYRKALVQALNNGINSIPNMTAYDWGHFLGESAMTAVVGMGVAGSAAQLERGSVKLAEMYSASELPGSGMLRSIRLQADIDRIGSALPLDFQAGKIARENKMLRFEWAEEANTTLVKDGAFSPPYLPSTLTQVYKTKSSEAFVQVWSKDTTKPSVWMMRRDAIADLTAEEIKHKYSLPKLPNRIVDVNLPPGVTIRRGKVNSAFGGGENAIQYEILDSQVQKKWYGTPKPL